jgi:pyruvate formate lyase activating enzyme
VEACPEHALELRAGRIEIDRDRCTRCGDCVQVCPTRALAFDGREVDSGEVVNDVMKDEAFYALSGGGVTLSGGDPLVQPEFARDILARCKARRVHTAMETCLAAGWETVEPFLAVVDLFLVDLKLGDEAEHRDRLGVPASLVKDNLLRLAESGGHLWVRVPLIPGVTATPGNLDRIGRFMRDRLPGVPVDLVNFNPLARSKYERMGLDRPGHPGDGPFDEGQLRAFRDALDVPGPAHPAGHKEGRSVR